MNILLFFYLSFEFGKKIGQSHWLTKNFYKTKQNIQICLLDQEVKSEIE
jgi:hypothetical protein